MELVKGALDDELHAFHTRNDAFDAKVRVRVLPPRGSVCLPV